MSSIPEPNEASPVGGFVRQHLPQILEYCQRHPDEFINLQDRAYCLATLRLSYPMLTPRTASTRPHKCWSAASSAPFTDHGFWVTSEWVKELHTAHFLVYLLERGITPIGVSREFLEWAELTVDELGSTSSAPGGPRYRGTPIGVAQNALVRYLMSNIAFEAFTKDDWDEVKAVDFGGRCAYCGDQKTMEMDHAVPINRTHLGEHRLGNLVPACRSCNGKKGQADVRDFVDGHYQHDPSQAQDRKAAIAAHAEARGYVPIEDREGIAPLIEEARSRIKEIADEYLGLINSRLTESRH